MEKKGATSPRGASFISLLKEKKREKKRERKK